MESRGSPAPPLFEDRTAALSLVGRLRRRLRGGPPAQETTERVTVARDKRSQLPEVLAEAQNALSGMGPSSETAIESATRTFQGLARQSDALLKGAGAVVACVESESMGEVLPAVQALCLTVSALLEERLEAAASILDALKGEDRLLKQLTQITRRQGAIASHLSALSVLTDVEVAQLGSAGGDFVVLAEELATFAKSISQQTFELSSKTAHRHKAIEESGRELAATVPKLRENLNRLETGIGQNIQEINARLEELAQIPAQFRSYAEQSSEQIARVVAAIQAHDITRQQIEHVHSGLQMISEKARGPEGADNVAFVHAGLAVQASQLQNAKRTVDHWTSQAGACMGALRHLSVSDLVRIGPAVLQQERDLTAHLGQIDSLKQKCEDYNQKVQETLAGLSDLLEIVNEHLTRSESVRHRLQLLTFNSLVEAHRLGARGAAVSAIAKLIREVSAEWTEIADQSKLTLAEITKLVEKTNRVMEVFSDARNAKLREDEAYVDTVLENVRNAASFVASESAKMQAVTDQMQSDLASADSQDDELKACFRPLDDTMSRIEGVRRAIEADYPRVADLWNAAEIESLFSPSYTTEIERQVQNAVLHGTEMPALQQMAAGNDVELF